jgi:hypothetical protein
MMMIFRNITANTNAIDHTLDSSFFWTSLLPIHLVSYIDRDSSSGKDCLNYHFDPIVNLPVIDAKAFRIQETIHCALK